MDINRVRAVFVAATFFVVGFAGDSTAQDHYKCFKFKDISQFKSATANFVPSQPQFIGENCSIKGKGAELCVPADKINVVVEDGTLQDFPTQALANAQLCYKVKCPATLTQNVQVSDQFSTRTVAKGKASKVCGPAIEQ
jgi:hypothetical protein